MLDVIGFILFCLWFLLCVVTVVHNVKNKWIKNLESMFLLFSFVLSASHLFLSGQILIAIMFMTFVIGSIAVVLETHQKTKENANK